MAESIRNASASENAYRGVGHHDWVNLSNATGAANSTYASSTCTDFIFHTSYLHLTTFGFSITEQVVGIKLTITGYVTSQSATSFTVKLLKSGTPISGSSGSSNNFDLPESNGDTSFGGPTDLWGTTWSTSEVNASNFGVRAYGTMILNTTATYYTDAVEITIYTPSKSFRSLMGVGV